MHYNPTLTAMRTPILTTLMALALSITTSQAISIHTGSLSSGAGLTGTPNSNWAVGSEFSWVVTEEPGTGWNYSYTLTVTGKDISHIVTEVSDTFETSNVLGAFVGNGVFELKSLAENGNQYDPGSSNPGIPGSFSGIKVDTNGDVQMFTWSFSSNRVPVWGDFHAKSGGRQGEEVYLFNDGFTGPVDSDPDMLVNPADSGSVDNHILVPNSVTDPEGPGIPEPSTSMLGALGLVLILRRRLR